MDFDGDGKLDILTGSWPGELYVFRGQGPGEFAAKEKILDKDGHPINIGGGVKETEDEIMITGDAEFKKDDKGESIVVYNGKTYKSTKDKQLFTTGCASVPFATDWNGDGAIDLLVGDIGGRVGLYLNTGTTKKPLFDKPEFLSAEGKKISAGHDAGPTVADWDGDGLNDLLLAGGDGDVQFFKNTGTAKEPKLAKPVTLVEKAQRGEPSTEPRRGMRAKICVADLNGDGKPDLLLGDYTTQKVPPKKMTEEEEKTIADAKKKMAEHQKEYRVLIDKVFGPKKEKDPEELKNVTKNLNNLQMEMQKLREKIPPEEETHGYIWFFERQSMTTASK